MSQLPHDVLRPYRERDARTAFAPSGRVALETLAGMEHRENIRGTAAMVREMDEDYQIKFGRLVLEAELKSVPVTISAEGGGERAEALAADLTKLWRRNLSSACDSFAYGRVAYEKVRKFDPGQFLTFIDLDALPYELTELRITDGRYDGFDLTGKGGKVHIDAADSWWLAIDATALEPHGKSRYAGAARKSYLDRKESRRLRALFLQKFAIGWAKAHVESRYKHPETGEITDGHAKIQQAFDAMRSAGLITFDNARATKSDGTEGEYLDDIETLPVPTSAAPLDETLDGMDVEQLRALGIPEKTVTEGEAVGSFAMVSMQMRVLLAVVDGLLSQMAESFQEYVVNKAVELNWPEGERPTLAVSYAPLTEGPTGIVVDIAKSILTGQATPLVMSGGIDVPEILKKAGVPLTPDMAAIWADPARRAALLPAAPAAPAGPFGFSMAADGKGVFLAGLPVRPELTAPQLPPAPTGFMADLPTRRQLVEDGLDRLNDLYADLSQALAERSVERFTDVQSAIRSLRGQIAVAGRILGMVSLWRPRLASAPAGAPRAKPLTLAMDLSGFDFPWLTSAVDFLKAKELLSDEDFAILDKDERAKALSIDGVDDQEILEGARSALIESITAGEALPKFRARIDEIVSLPKSQTETLFRTQTKQAFLAGQETALANPVVGEEFPYVEFCATDDTRVRDSHWELDGKIAKRGSPEHALFLRAFSDYNCRCTPIPLTAAEAESKGVSSMRDLGSTARKEYANP